MKPINTTKPSAQSAQPTKPDAVTHADTQSAQTDAFTHTTSATKPAQPTKPDAFTHTTSATKPAQPTATTQKITTKSTAKTTITAKNTTKPGKKPTNPIAKFASALFWLSFALLWQLLDYFGALPAYIIPSPLGIIRAVILHASDIYHHAKTTLLEAFLGLFYGILGAVIMSYLMDKFRLLYKIAYPAFVLLQSIPTIAIAPLLVLYLGYDLAPKVALVAISTTFPLLLGLVQALGSYDREYERLLLSMHAKPRHIMLYVKLPACASAFCAGVKVAISYAFISAVVAEWLGGFEGLGVMLIQSKKLFEYELMFGVIAIIACLSLASVWAAGWCLNKALSIYINNRRDDEKDDF